MIKTLLGVRLRAMFGTLTSGRKKGGKETVSKGKVALMTLMYLYLIAVFGGMFTFLAVSMAPVLIAFKLDWFYFAIFTIVAFTLVFVFSIFETKSELFECKDNELLLSMPIKPRDIVLSRIFTVLIYNYLETALVMLPAIIVYIIYGGGAKGIVGSVPVLLFLPLLATALASGAGYGVALLAKRLKNNSYITTAISLVFLGLYFWGYNTFMGTGDEQIDFVGLSVKFSGIKFLGEASMLHPLYTTLLVSVSLFAAFIFYYVISRSYISIVTAKDGGKRKEYKKTYLKGKSPFSALVKKELSLFTSSSTYMLNSGLGMIFTIALGVMMLTSGGELKELGGMLFERPKDDPLVANAAVAVMASAFTFVSSMTTISGCALSLEGNRLWITRTMPISSRTILLAKTAPAVILPAIPNIFAAICIIIAFKPEPIAAVLAVFVLLFAGVASAFLGTFFNALMPKFSYQNEAQAVKQSLSVFISMMAMLFVAILVTGLAILFSFILEIPVLGMLFVLLLLAGIISAFAIAICGPLSRKLDSISA